MLENEEDLSEKIMEDTEKKVSLQEIVDFLKKDFSKPLFEADDMKAAAGLGLYFRMTARSQEKELGTRTLIKDTRMWLREMNKDNLLRIFAECNRVQFILADKNKKSSASLSLVRRELIEPYLIADVWESPAEKLSVAFMIGYDSYSAVYRNRDTK